MLALRFGRGGDREGQSEVSRTLRGRRREERRLSGRNRLLNRRSDQYTGGLARSLFWISRL